MRLIVDLQVCQGSARHRGMGRYSLELASAMAANARGHEVIFTASTAYARELVELREHLRHAVPDAKFRACSLPAGTARANGKPWLTAAAQRWQQFLLEELEPDVIQLASVFSGYHDDIVIPEPPGPGGTLWAATLYDLIPLSRPDEFLSTPSFRQWYEERVATLQRFGILLAISEATRQDSIQRLGIDDDTVANIGAAIGDNFHNSAKRGGDSAQLNLKLGIERPFVFYLGGTNPHKNFDGMLKSYALLPSAIREQHQLVLAGEISETNIGAIRQRSIAAGLGEQEVVLVGNLSDDDLKELYASCQAFVFPSWTEGFGLPILEAMSCGAPVIASNTSSMPEVVGRADATFDPHDASAISEKMRQVLEDGQFRQDLIRHGTEHSAKFRWSHVAEKAWEALEASVEKRQEKVSTPPKAASTPASRGAIVMGGAPSTSNFQALIQNLEESEFDWANWELVTPPKVNYSDDFPEKKTQPADWLLANYEHLDTILYWIGNGEHLKWMRPLLASCPGKVVLPHFFPAGQQRESGTLKKTDLQSRVMTSHGYHGLLGTLAMTPIDIARAFPCHHWITMAESVVCPFRWFEWEARRWYGDRLPPFQVAAALRELNSSRDYQELRQQERNQWNVADEQVAILIWTEKGTALEKETDRFLENWESFNCADLEKPHLVFATPDAEQVSDRAPGIDGCDVLVFLGNQRKGGEAKPVCDALEQGKRIVSNSLHSGELPDPLNGHGFRVSADPTVEELTESLIKVCQLSVERPASQDTTESSTSQSDHRFRQRVFAFARSLGPKPNQPTKQEINQLSEAIAGQMEDTGLRQILFDVTELARIDSKSGIQRVVRSVLWQFLKTPPAGYRVEPVRQGEGRWFYAREFTNHLIQATDVLTQDTPVEANAGDVFLGIDLNCRIIEERARGELENWRARDVFLVSIIYDLLPVLHSQWFNDEMARAYHGWLETVTETMDAAIAISDSVAQELKHWIGDSPPVSRSSPLQIGYFHLGADVEESLPSFGGEEAELVPEPETGAPNLLMVGTVEPRKGHPQALDAFDILWEQGSPARLLIVGKCGWKMESFTSRLENHPELGKRLFWLEGVTDEQLLRVYSRSSALLAASYGEGFGLPLIEGARHGLPIIARDIPVFREVAGEHAAYFAAGDAAALAQSLNEWIAQHELGNIPSSTDLPWLTWEQSAQQLWQAICDVSQGKIPHLQAAPASAQREG